LIEESLERKPLTKREVFRT